jgi:UDP-GlcNAc:undecaprenyl-phosphate GlcNAc-1-phosphate transferase
MKLLIALVCAFSLSALSMPLILKIAERFDLYDAVDERKIHNGQIPRLGGLGMFVAFFATTMAVTLVTGKGVNTGGRFWEVVVCMFVVQGIGLVDDIRDLRARYKFLLELAAAIFLAATGFHFDSIGLPFGAGTLTFGAYSYPLTVIWIIGVTNAVNLIDGMDGLAGSVSIFAAAAFGVFFLGNGDTGGALACFTLIGAIFGFLAFNLPPARIFMGDSGSLFLGFTLSILPLIGFASGTVEIRPIPSITILLIPIFDTFAAMIRRTRAGVSVFSPDKLHLHHKLLGLGLGVKGALGVVCGAQAILCLVAVSSLVLPGNTSFFLNVSVWMLYAFLFFVLGVASAKKGLSAEKREISIQGVQRTILTGSLVSNSFEAKREPSK